MSSLVNLVVNEMQTLPDDRHAYTKGSNYWLCCPLHNGGRETTPSAKINLDPDAPAPVGHFYCFGCAQKMHWNDFAILFNLKQFTGGMLRESQATVYVKDGGPDPVPPDYSLFAEWPANTPWRGIPGKVMAKFNARSIKFGRESRMYLPVTLYGENMGGINCALQGARTEREKSYINTDGEWSARSLIGFDLARKRRGPLWAVEGSRDVTHVYSNKARVVGLIGSKVSPEKIALIKDLDPPSILIATDPDAAGDHAAEDLMDAFDGLIPIRRLPLKRDKKTGKKKQDPADLPGDVIRGYNNKMIALYGKGE